jgi:hypothetical protein
LSPANSVSLGMIHSLLSRNASVNGANGAGLRIVGMPRACAAANAAAVTS